MAAKLGILAGGGLLPGLIVRACQDSGREFFVITFEGQAIRDTFADVPHAQVRLGAAGQAIRHLRDAGVKDLVMAGAIKQPSFAMLRPDAWTIRFFATRGARALGDDGLLTALIRTLEETEGFRVVGVDELLSGLLAVEGVYGCVQPGADDEETIEAAICAAQAIGRNDIGQAAVAQSGRVLTTEDAAGTDALLEREVLDGHEIKLLIEDKPLPEQPAPTLTEEPGKQQVLKPVMGDTAAQQVDYSHDPKGLVDRVNSRELQLAFLLKPFPRDAFEQLVGDGQRLPSKSTFFYPKLPTGLVIHRLDGPL